MKPENLGMAIEVIKGAVAALDLVGGDLGELEQTELFRALTEHNIAQITADASSYLNTLRQVKTLADNNGGKLPADDPSIKQQLVKASLIGQGSAQIDNDYSDNDNDYSDNDNDYSDNDNDYSDNDNDYSDNDSEFKSALAGVFGGYNFL